MAMDGPLKLTRNLFFNLGRGAAVKMVLWGRGEYVKPYCKGRLERFTRGWGVKKVTEH